MRIVLSFPDVAAFALTATFGKMRPMSGLGRKRTGRFQVAGR